MVFIITYPNFQILSSSHSIFCSRPSQNLSVRLLSLFSKGIFDFNAKFHSLKLMSGGYYNHKMLGQKNYHRLATWSNYLCRHPLALDVPAMGHGCRCHNSTPDNLELRKSLLPPHVVESILSKRLEKIHFSLNSSGNSPLCLAIISLTNFNFFPNTITSKNGIYRLLVRTISMCHYEEVQLMVKRTAGFFSPCWNPYETPWKLLSNFTHDSIFFLYSYTSEHEDWRLIWWEGVQK